MGDCRVVKIKSWKHGLSSLSSDGWPYGYSEVIEDGKRMVNVDIERNGVRLLCESADHAGGCGRALWVCNGRAAGR